MYTLASASAFAPAATLASRSDWSVLKPLLAQSVVQTLQMVLVTIVIGGVLGLVLGMAFRVVFPVFLRRCTDRAVPVGRHTVRCRCLLRRCRSILKPALIVLILLIHMALPLSCARLLRVCIQIPG